MRLSDLLISEATEYEFKAALEVGKPKNWLKTVSAFSNGNKIAYVRLGEESVQAPPHILNELILKGQNQSFDATFSQYNKSDFSFSIFEATYRMKTQRKIEESDYISFKLADVQGRLTYAGVLSSDQCPLLQSRVFCTRWNGLTMGSVFDDAIDDKEYEGNIFSLLENAKQFIKNNYRVRWKKTPDGRVDMPDYDPDAIHEAVVNALVHRSYFVPGTEVHINMYDDRLEIQSPGGMFNGKKIQDLDLWNIPSERRNPILADLFQRMKLMERRGSGIKKILEIYEGKKQPAFISTETDFTTIFYNNNYKKSGSEKAEVKSGSKKAEVKSGSRKITQRTEEQYKRMLAYLDAFAYAKAPELAKLLDVKSSRINVLLKELESKGEITSKGTYRDKIYMRAGK